MSSAPVRRWSVKDVVSLFHAGELATWNVQSPKVEHRAVRTM